MGKHWGACCATLFGVLGLSSWTLAQGNFANPRGSSGVFIDTQAIGILDATRDGSPELFSPAIFLSNFLVSLDEDGNRVAQGLSPLFPLPAFPPSALPTARGLDSADMDGDGRADVVGIANSGAVFILPNGGNYRIGPTTFGAVQVVDFIGPQFTVNPPFINLSVSNIRAVDIDQDGTQEILIAVAPIDVWSGTTLPGIMVLYKRDVTGTFQKYSLNLPGNAIDLEWADLDGNGAGETAVVVTETGSVGNFSYEIHHAAFNPATLFQFINFPQYLPRRVTSIEFANVLGGPSPDYVLATTDHSGGLLSSTIYAFEGNGAGQINSSSWTTIPLPPNTTGLGDFVMSVKARDFDRDGTTDLALLRGYVTPAPFGSGQAAQTSAAEIFVVTSPGLYTVSTSTIPLPGFLNDGWAVNHNARFLPITARPDLLHTLDLGLDRSIDLMVANVYQVSTTSMTTSVVTIKNLAGPQAGDPALEKVGNPSGGAPGYPARAGFDGPPVIGNSNFNATISNIRGGSLLGLVWSPLGIENFAQDYGIDIHIVPAEYGFMKIASGSGAGQGFGTYPLPIPNNPSLLGDMGYFQWGYYDPGLGVFGGTQATHLVLGQ